MYLIGLHPLTQEVASTFDKLEVEILSDDEDMDDEAFSESGNDVGANLSTKKKRGNKDQVRACKNLASQFVSLVEVGAASGSNAG
jgi:hypothetical protein